MAHVVLPPADYYRLRWMQAESEAAAARAETVAATYRLALQELARAHGFDPAVAYQWDNRACALVTPASATTDEQ